MLVTAVPARPARSVRAIVLLLVAMLASWLAPTVASAAAELTVAPASVDFGDQIAGTTETRTITVKNTGDAPLEVSAVDVVSGSFSFTALGGSIDPGGSLDLTVTFAAPADGDGPDTGSAVVSSDAGDVHVNALGNVIVAAAQVSVDKPIVNFGYQRPGVPHPCPVTVTNTGNVPLNFGDVKIIAPGDDGGPIITARIAGPLAANTAIVDGSAAWSVTGSQDPLGPGETRVFTLYFAPTEPIRYQAQLSIETSAPDSPLRIPLDGWGQVGRLTPGAASLAFGNVVAGSKLVKTITVKNTGTFAASLSTAITGAGAGKYKVSGPTGPLALNATRKLTVTFAPTTRGTFAAKLVLGGNAFNAPLSVPLSGKGVARSRS